MNEVAARTTNSRKKSTNAKFSLRYTKISCDGDGTLRSEQGSVIIGRENTLQNTEYAIATPSKILFLI